MVKNSTNSSPTSNFHDDSSFCEIIESSLSNSIEENDKKEVLKKEFVPFWKDCKKIIDPQGYIDVGREVTTVLCGLSEDDIEAAERAKQAIIKILDDCKKQILPKEPKRSIFYVDKDEDSKCFEEQNE